MDVFVLLLTVGVVVVERDMVFVLVPRDTVVDELLLRDTVAASLLAALRVVRVVVVLLLTVLWARLEELFVLTVEFVERVELFVTTFALEELRPVTASPLNDVLRPVVFEMELLRLDAALLVTVLRPFIEDDEA